MERLTAKLLNDFQRGFPLSPAPFAQIARSLDTDAQTVIERLRDLQGKGVISRVGPVFRPNTVGASTLAAMAVPDGELAATAALVNAFPQVNHNYERDHRYNLWFVVTAPDRRALEWTLREIRGAARHPMLSLPLVRDYHIDLGFEMRLDGRPVLAGHAGGPDEDGSRGARPGRGRRPEGAEDLIGIIQDGLPLVSRPYRHIGARLRRPEQAVIDDLRALIDSGVIKRLGVVVRHREVGYRANAMVVWDVADDRVDALGRRLGREERVTLCYRRPRRLPDWPYNLFCMVHGRARGEVELCIEGLVERLGLGDIPRAVLFSRRCFKQRGARYRLRH
jgi:DNA-binding Lrp family transcriptional regulator